MPRMARRESSTSIYHVVNRGMGQQIIFEDDADRRFFLHKLDSLLLEHEGTLLAFCLMDNHYHLLIDLAFSELSKLMHRLQTSYAGYFNRVHGHVGSVFGTRFKSEAVENDEYLMTVVRYIHENPQKAHLCQGLNYPWSSYKEYLGNATHISPSFVLDVFGSKHQFELFHQVEHDNDQCLDITDGAPIRLSDNEALRIATELLGSDGMLNVKGLERDLRDEVLARLKVCGLGVRQIQRLTGVPLKAISMAGKGR